MKDIIAKSIGNALNERGVSDSQLAKALDINRVSVFQWRNGIALPTVPNAILAARYLHMTLEEFLLNDLTHKKEEMRLDDPLYYDLIIANGKKFHQDERSKHHTVRSILNRAFGPAAFDEPRVLICENMLDGIVIRVGNHEKMGVEIIGTTEGYA